MKRTWASWQFVMFLILAVLVIAETLQFVTPSSGYSSKYASMQVIEKDGKNEILVDETTGVLYMKYCTNDTGYAIIPLYNANGTLKNITDYESKEVVSVK